MRSFVALALLAVACSHYDGDPADPDAGPAPAATSSSSSSASSSSGATAGDAGSDAAVALPECTAQRVLHLAAGNGALAWFTLLWPVPAMIDAFDPAYAYDAPALAVATLPAPHPLRIRTPDPARPFWAQAGSAPLLSVYVAGKTSVHSSTPTMTVTDSDHEVLALAAIRQQAAFGAPMPVLGYSDSGIQTYGQEPGAPTAANADGIDAVVSALRGRTPIDAQAETELRSFDGRTQAAASTSNYSSVAHLAARLELVLNLFRHNFTTTVLLPAALGDPHTALAAGNLASTTEQANLLRETIDTWYRALADYPEPSCLVDGKPISLADNVVLLVTGDTPHHPYEGGTSWPDTTPNDGNIVYVRSNGWLVPGWFGSFGATSRTNFDTETGLLSETASANADLRAMQAAFLYAVSRGDLDFAQTASNQKFTALRAR